MIHLSRLTSDGGAGNSSVGLIKFPIADIPSSVVKATLNVTAANHGGTLVPSTVTVHSVAPSKWATTTDSGNDKQSQQSSIFGDYNSTMASSLYSNFGCSASTSLGTINQNNPGAYAFDVTKAVSDAKKAGQSELCLLFMMPQCYNDNNSSTWSDVKIMINSTNITYSDKFDDATAVSSANTSAVNSVTNLNTNVTTIHGNFQNDNNNLSDTDYNNIYNNILYSPTVTSSNPTGDGYAVTLYGEEYWSKVWVSWFHAETVMLYDGESTPSTGIMTFVGSGGNKLNGGGRLVICNIYMLPGTEDGLSFKGSWKGIDSGRTNGKTNLNMQWLYNTQGDKVNCTSVDSGPFYDTNKNGGEWMFANLIQYTGSMADDVYSKTINPTYAFYEHNNSNGDNNVRLSGQSSIPFHIINYKPLKAAINRAITLINDVKANPSKYDPTWVASLANAAKALVAAKPNNFVNSSSKNVSGYANAARAAVTQFNSVNAPTLSSSDQSELATYHLIYKTTDGSTTLKTVDYKYDSSVNPKALAPENTAKKPNNTNTHYTYSWNEVPTSLTVRDNVEYYENSTAETHNFICESVSATQHESVCSECGYESTPVSHNLSRINIGNNDDQHQLKCNLCNYDVMEKHSYGDAVEVTPATCAKNQIVSQTCSQCSHVWEHEVAGTQTSDHTFDIKADKSNVAPDPDNAGKHIVTCTVCGAATTTVECTRGTIIVDGKTADAIPANCQHGNISEAKRCIHCPYTEGGVDDGNIDTVNGHNYTTDLVDLGNGKHGHKCQNGNCDSVIDVAAHDFSVEVSNTATCTQDGIKTLKCASCSATKTENVDAFGHDYEYTYTGNGHHKLVCSRGDSTIENQECQLIESNVVDSDCGHTGSKDTKCELCGHEEKNVVIPTKGEHDFTGVDAVEKIETIDGKETSIKHTKRCNTCGLDIEFEHNYDEENVIVVPASCTVDGTETRTCKDCGYQQITKTGNATGHSFFGDYVNVEPGKHARKCSNNGCTATGLLITGVHTEGATEACSGGTATCSAAAICKDCNTAYGTTNPANHSNLKIVTLVNKTCTSDGMKAHWYCSGCDKYYSDAAGTKEVTRESLVIPAGHNLVEVAGKNATCTVDGIKAHWECTACGKFFSDAAGNDEITDIVIKAHHTLTKVEAEAESCTTDGNIEHWHCSVCGKNFSDADGKTEVKNVTIAKHHTFGDAMVPAVAETCDTDGNVAYWHCSACGKNFEADKTTEIADVVVKAHHTLTHHAAKAATCTENGNVEYWSCSGTCHSNYADANATTIIADEDIVIAAHHDLAKVEAKAATCTSVGNIEYWHCSGTCGNNYTDATATTEIENVTINALGHNYTGEAVNHSNGTHSFRCVNGCNTLGVMVEENGNLVAKTGNTQACDGVATCVTPATCSVCHVSRGTVNEFNHTNLVKHDGTPATCETAGQKDSWVCDGCHNTYTDAAGTAKVNSDADLVIPAREHAWDNGTLIARPTQNENGTWVNGTYHYVCSRDTSHTKDEHTAKRANYAAFDEAYAKVEGFLALDLTEAGRTLVTEALATADGLAKNLIEDEITKEQPQVDAMTDYLNSIIAQINENENWQFVNPKEELVNWAGYDSALAEYLLMLNGGANIDQKDQDRVVEIQALAAPIKADKAASKSEYQAKVDGWEAEIRAIVAKLDVCEKNPNGKTHVWSEDWKVIIKPTETSTGTKAHCCIYCGIADETSYVAIPMLVKHTHDDANWIVTVEPTCTETGSREFYCDKCDEKIVEIIPAYGHDWSEWKTVDKATCQKEGLEERHCLRNNCSEAETRVLPKSFHHEVVIRGYDATCEKPGLTAGRACEYCGYIFLEQVEIPALGHMDLGDDGYCDNCGEPMMNVIHPGNCRCICHSDSGIRQFLYKIALVFWKLFGISKTCNCGATHY